ncbi:hypothetical protein OPV22_014530 [Ensete ventricosum]|uniref:Protein DCL, chloroplastic n=1 Tax=Ensete ventricosum TaxID=4639 RepID=A0AAV8R3G4_ENSVE|nr:hypothetical protein OPV22_014530 [Ensete ventricosum]
MASSAAALLLLRGAPLRARVLRATAAALPRRFASGLVSTDEPLSPPAAASAGEGAPAATSGPKRPVSPLYMQEVPWAEHPEYRRWKDMEEEILKDIEPIRILTKEILHSDRYMNGERLSAEDEKEVIEKLLAYHPHSEDKIGCGLDSIMLKDKPYFEEAMFSRIVTQDTDSSCIFLWF